MLICVALFAIIGVWMFIKPVAYWKVLEKWKGNASEPSQFFVTYLRITGGVFCLIAVILLIIFLVAGNI